jgi:hypothetical protein
MCVYSIDGIRFCNIVFAMTFETHRTGKSPESRGLVEVSQKRWFMKLWIHHETFTFTNFAFSQALTLFDIPDNTIRVSGCRLSIQKL